LYYGGTNKCSTRNKSKHKMAPTLSHTVVYKHVDAKDDNTQG